MSIVFCIIFVCLSIHFCQPLLIAAVVSTFVWMNGVKGFRSSILIYWQINTNILTVVLRTNSRFASSRLVSYPKLSYINFNLNFNINPNIKLQLALPYFYLLNYYNTYMQKITHTPIIIWPHPRPCATPPHTARLLIYRVSTFIGYFIPMQLNAVHVITSCQMNLMPIHL